MGALGTLFILFGMFLFFAAVVAMFKPLKTLRMPTRKAAVVGLCLSLGSCVVGSAMVNSTPEGKKAQAESAAKEKARAAEKAKQQAAEEAERNSLKGADSSITEVSRGENSDTIEVRAHIKAAWDDKQYVDFAGVTVADVGKALKRGVSEDQPPADYVSMHFTVAGTDRLGNDIDIAFLWLRFPAADLRAANYENLTFDRVLNLATQASAQSPAGKQAVTMWCLDESHASQANVFCRKVLGLG